MALLLDLDWLDELEALDDEPKCPPGEGPRCPNCGRFAKPGVVPQVNIMGEMEYSVHCKTHGEVWTS